MTAKLLKCFWGIISTALIALYVFIFYELAAVPAILEWSFYGVLLVLSIVGLLVLSVPAAKRVPTTVLAITFLLAVRALDNLSSYTAVWEALSGLFVFFLLLIVGKIIGHFSIRRYLVTFLVAVILTSSMDLSQAPLWTEFFVKWESPTLYKRYAAVDYFPVKLVDVDGDGTQEIITQQNIEEAEREKVQVVKKGVKYDILTDEESNFAVYKWDSKAFKELTPDHYDVSRLKANLPIDYLGYPFYETTNLVGRSGAAKQIMQPLAGKPELVEKSVSFVAFPFQMLKLSQVGLEKRLTNQKELGQSQPTSSVGKGNIIPGPPLETVKIDHVLTVSQADKNKEPIGIIDDTMISDIGTSEIIIGDVDNDKTDELLLTSETSRILKLKADGKWQILWTSIDKLDEKARFQKFRFEDFAPLGQNKAPQIIALSKSYVRNNPTRYMTGYVYRDGSLHQQWRVFSGLINLRAGDVDGDGENELVGYMYRAHRLFVLEKHNLPVVTGIYVVTGVLILWGLYRQRRNKRKSGGEQNA
ncbi:MAG TPA: hypothetical protein VNT57_03935 [Desulfobacteria bacterium]|nr:hypothetical protein [Desulfobacteria bacterium]